jgi:TrmH family RNA methyltransferase
MQQSTIGRHNPRFQDVRRALRSGTLTADGWLPVEGPHLVAEALGSGLEVGEVFVRDDVPPPTGAGRVYRVGPAAFDHLGATREPQGLVALVRPPRFTLPQLISRAGLLVVLGGLQDPGNVGAVIRLADAFGCAGAIAVDPTVNFYNAKVVRASAGSLFRLPHVRVPDLGPLHRELAAASVAVVGTAPGAPAPIDSWDWTRPTAVLFGNEGQGLGESEAGLCDRILSIPHSGKVESLNTASAAAIVLYEAARAGGR